MKLFWIILQVLPLLVVATSISDGSNEEFADLMVEEDMEAQQEEPLLFAEEQDSNAPNQSLEAYHTASRDQWSLFRKLVRFPVVFCFKGCLMSSEMNPILYAHPKNRNSFLYSLLQRGRRGRRGRRGNSSWQNQLKFGNVAWEGRAVQRPRTVGCWPGGCARTFFCNSVVMCCCLNCSVSKYIIPHADLAHPIVSQCTMVVFRVPITTMISILGHMVVVVCGAQHFLKGRRLRPLPIQVMMANPYR